VLKKSAAADGRSAISLRAAGFDLPAPDALYTTLTLRDAQSLSGWWPSDLQVLSDGGENELILGASRATKSEPPEPEDALQVCEPHLDLLALTPRLLEALGASERPGNISGVLIDVARDLA
jgi:hypothetical protein